MAKRGRPTVADLDDPALVEELCLRLVSGQGIKAICRAKDMPHETTVYRRMFRDEAFASRIAHAREAQQDAMSEQCREIADSATAENWMVARLRVGTRQWTMARLAPKKYGSVQEHRHGGTEGGQPIPVRFEGLTEAQLASFAERLQHDVDLGPQAGAADPGEGGAGPASEGGDGPPDEVPG